MTIQTVQISNTFNEFRETTNLVIDEVNKLGDGTGNLVVDIITANTIFGASLGIVGDTGNNGSDYISLGSEPLTITGSNGISTIVDTDSSTVIVNLNNTGVSANTYGSASQIPVITVDAQGRITSASNASISSAMTVAGNTGNDVISFATETLRIVGTNGISTSVSSGSNTVTINLDSTSTEIAANTLVKIFDNPNIITSGGGLPDYYDQFGEKLAITKDYLVVSSSDFQSGPDGYLIVFDIKTQKLLQKIQFPTSNRSFDASENYIVVGTPTSGGGSDAIGVYDIPTGKLLHTLYNPNKANNATVTIGNAFGTGIFSVGDGSKQIRIHGDYCVIGVPDEVGAESSLSGQVYVYKYKTNEQVFTASNPNIYGNTQDVFGTAVDIYDNKIIVGAPREASSNSANGIWFGAAHVYDFSSKTLLYTVENPNQTASGASDFFGQAVAIGKNYFAVGGDQQTNAVVRIHKISDGSLVRSLSGTDFSPTLSPFGGGLSIVDDTILIRGGTNKLIIHDINANTSVVNTTVSNYYYLDASDEYYAIGDLSYNSYRGRVCLYTWKDVKKLSAGKISDTSEINFSFGQKIDKSSQLFNLPSIALKYAPTELVHSIATPETIAGNEFGKRTAITNKYFIASSDSTSNTGNVHVYDLKSGSLRYYLTNPNPVGTTANDYFGSTLAADDTYLAVGSFEDDTANTDSGKVYVYQIDTGSLLYTLNNPNQTGNSANDFFGSSGLALANNYIAVGAHGESNTIYSNTGIVYVYSIPTFSSNTINTATRIIYNPEHANNDFFGSSIATDGRYILVGAYNKTVSGNTGAGKAHIFNLSNGVRVSGLLPPTSNTNDYFGYSVSMDNDYAVVGAYNKNNGANTSAGAVYIYRTYQGQISDGNFNPVIQHILINQNQNYLEANDQFGFSVSINEGKLAVGSVKESITDDLSYANSGIIYLYDIDFSSANLSNIIHNPSPSGTHENDEFGYYIASNRNYIVTTARNEDSGATDAGRVYVYATRPVRDIQVPELSQVERITLSDGTQLTPTTVATRSNTKLTVSGNSGSNDEISLFSDTLRIVGSNGISTSVSSGSNTVIINNDGFVLESTANSSLVRINNPNFYNLGDYDYFSRDFNFGSSVLTEDYIIVGAGGEDRYTDSTDPGGFLGVGIIYIFDIQTKKLIRTIEPPADSGVSPYFGKYIGASGDYLFTHMSIYSPSFRTGVYVYQISTGKLLHILYSPDLDYSSLSGSSNALAYANYTPFGVYDDKIVIGMETTNGSPGSSLYGYVYVFNYKTGELVYSRANVNANTASIQSDGFGTTTDIYGDYILVASPYEDIDNSPSASSGRDGGYVYLINYKTNTVVYSIKNPEAGNTGVDFSYFGRYISLGKDYFAVKNNLSAGTANTYVYKVSDGSLYKKLTDFQDRPVHIYDKYLIRSNPSNYRFAEIWDLDKNEILSNNIQIVPSTSFNSLIGSVNSKYILVHESTNAGDLPPFAGSVYLSQWRDIGKESIPKLTDVTSIDFAFGKTIDKYSQLFNLPNIALKYAPTELIHSIATPENIVANEFGKRTAITNKYFIASSDSTSNTGNVHIYDLKSGALRYYLTNPNPVGDTANDFFGSSLAADDTYLAVGSFEDDTANTDSGKVYVYQIDTGGLLYTLNNPTANGTSANDFFGSSGLALSNNIIAVGAHREANSSFSNTGIVYVYSIPTFAGNVINSATRIIYNPEPASNDFFGSSVSLDNEFLLVGAYNKTVDANIGAGKAYLFNANTGALLKTHTANTVNANDYFGFSTTIHGDYYAVGAYNKNRGANTAVGVTYVYRTKQYSNTEIFTLTNPNIYWQEANDQFGYSVSLNNGKLAVSAVGEDYAGFNSSGVIYLYDVDFNSANLVNVIQNPNANNTAANDEFGYYIASNRNYIVTTGRYEDSGNTDAGRVYVYSTRNVRDMQIPELSQVERITLADGTQITPTTVVTTSNINKYASGSYLYLSSNFGGF